jgi:hypothetical protein
LWEKLYLQARDEGYACPPIDGVLQITIFVVDVGYLNIWFTKDGKMLKLTYPGIEKDIGEGLIRVVSPNEADRMTHEEHSSARTVRLPPSEHPNEGQPARSKSVIDSFAIWSNSSGG